MLVGKKKIKCTAIKVSSRNCFLALFQVQLRCDCVSVMGDGHFRLVFISAAIIELEEQGLLNDLEML